VIKTKKTVLLSTGMSSIGEIDEIVSKIRRTGVPFALFQCTSSYPCPPEKVGLNLISFFKMRYRCPVGLSDHSGSIYPGLAAVVLGASLLEIHMTLDAKATGPDVSASLALTELKNLVQGVRFIEKMMKNPVKKNSLGQEMKYMRRIFMKSIVAAENLVAGTILKERHLAFKKPGTGIPAGDMYFVLGKKLKKSLRKDDFFKKEFLKRVHS
jgi:N-acetylneuraminate synthase